MSTYEAAIVRLIERARQIDQAGREWSPTPKRKKLEEIAKRIDELVAVLHEHGSAQFALEECHDRAPPPEFGANGLPLEVEQWGASYKGTIGHMCDLAESARRAAAELPHPNEKRALPFAALGLLHIRWRFGQPRPTLYEAGPCVQELKRVCDAAGLPRSTVALRGALKGALAEFDRFYCPDYIEDLFK